MTTICKSSTGWCIQQWIEVPIWHPGMKIQNKIWKCSKELFATSYQSALDLEKTLL